MYNPETYGWYQCDEEDYNSNDSPAEQAHAELARKQYTARLIAAMRTAVAEVPAYVERPQDAVEERYEFACTMCGWEKTLHVDDMAAYYERPFAPCGCGWECIRCIG